MSLEWYHLGQRAGPAHLTHPKIWHRMLDLQCSSQSDVVTDALPILGWAIPQCHQLKDFFIRRKLDLELS